MSSKRDHTYALPLFIIKKCLSTHKGYQVAALSFVGVILTDGLVCNVKLRLSTINH